MTHVSEAGLCDQMQTVALAVLLEGASHSWARDWLWGWEYNSKNPLSLLMDSDRFLDSVPVYWGRILKNWGRSCPYGTAGSLGLWGKEELVNNRCSSESFTLGIFCWCTSNECGKIYFQEVSGQNLKHPIATRILWLYVFLHYLFVVFFF